MFWLCSGPNITMTQVPVQVDRCSIEQCEVGPKIEHVRCRDNKATPISGGRLSAHPPHSEQIGVKMTKEPPKGLRANLKSTYSKMDDDKLKRTCKPVDYRKMLFGECHHPIHEHGSLCFIETRSSRIPPKLLTRWPCLLLGTCTLLRRINNETTYLSFLRRAFVVQVTEERAGNSI